MKNPFVKVKSRLECREIFNAIRGQSKVYFRLPSEQVVPFYPLTTIEGAQGLTIEGHLEVKNKIASSIVTGFFKYKQDRFFFITELNISGSRVYFNLERGLFKLQRRTAFRVKVASQNFFQCYLSPQDRKTLFPCDLDELSILGGRLILNVNEFSVETDRVNLFFELKNQKKLKFVANIRHFMMANQKLAIGFKFVGLDEVSKNRLKVFLMDLQKESLQKYYKELWEKPM